MRNKHTPKRGGNTGRNTSNRSTPKKDNKPDKSEGLPNHMFSSGTTAIVTASSDRLCPLYVVDLQTGNYHNLIPYNTPLRSFIFACCYHQSEIEILAIVEQYDYLIFAAKCPHVPHNYSGDASSYQVYIIAVDMAMLGRSGYNESQEPCFYERIHIPQTDDYDLYLDKDHCAMSICNDHICFFTIAKKSRDAKTVLLYTRVRLLTPSTASPNGKERITNTTHIECSDSPINEYEVSTNHTVAAINVSPVIAYYED